MNDPKVVPFLLLGLVVGATACVSGEGGESRLDQDDERTPDYCTDGADWLVIPKTASLELDAYEYGLIELKDWSWAIYLQDVNGVIDFHARSQSWGTSAESRDVWNLTWVEDGAETAWAPPFGYHVIHIVGHSDNDGPLESDNDNHHDVSGSIGLQVVHWDIGPNGDDVLAGYSLAISCDPEFSRVGDFRIIPMDDPDVNEAGVPVIRDIKLNYRQEDYPPKYLTVDLRYNGH